MLYLLAVVRITQWPQLADESDLAWLVDLLAWAHRNGLPAAIGMPVVEASANVAMFVPFGVLVPLVLRRPAWQAVVAGAVFSACLETSQALFFPDRVPSLQDVVMNTAGAALGALLLVQVTAARARRASRLAAVSSDPAGSNETAPRPRPTASPVATFLAESRLAPVELDLARVFLVGIGLWVVAGLVTGVLLALGHVDARPLVICGLGVALGLLALGWERRRRRRTRDA